MFADKSQAFKDANPDIFARDTGATAKLEPDPRDGTLGKRQVQTKDGRRFLVRIESFRKRLLDEDNLSEKAMVDLLRYAGIISQDSPGTTKIEVCQTKVGKEETEYVRVEVWEL